jgi:uncharacterized protein (DUF4415 family)
MQVESDAGRVFVIPSAQKEAGIRRAIADDPDTRELSDEALKRLCPVSRLKADINKQTVSLRLSPEVPEYFKSTGTDWQTRMDNVLKVYVDAQLTKGSG